MLKIRQPFDLPLPWEPIYGLKILCSVSVIGCRALVNIKGEYEVYD